jgi:HlyD family secretion protein
MRTVSILILGALCVACSPPPPAAVGTLERDRISLPAPVSERIASMAIREGDDVAAGTVLVTLEDGRVRARLQAMEAEVARLEQVLLEARQGARIERIDGARQQLRRAESVARNARLERDRVDAVVQRGLLPVSERDRARSANAVADADVGTAKAVLDELLGGTRVEEIAQAEAALATARASAAAAAIDLDRVRIVAPRAGRVESLPFEIGDQPPIGAALVLLLVGERPHARVYVPQPMRIGLAIGDAATVFIEGRSQGYAGHVRMIRSEPEFTPYFALSGEDAAQLSYLAEIELGADAGDLPLGVPVRAEFGAKPTQ